MSKWDQFWDTYWSTDPKSWKRHVVETIAAFFIVGGIIFGLMSFFAFFAYVS